MNEEEQKTFQNQLQKDPELQTQVDEFRQMMLGVEMSALSEQLDDFHAQISKTNPKKQTAKVRRLLVVRFAIAASVLFAVGFGAWWMFKTGNLNQALYTQFFETDPGLPTRMGSGNTTYDFDRGMVEYKFGNYDLALQQWAGLHAEKPESDTLNYFMGMANLAAEQTENAIPYLEVVSNLPDSEFHSNAQWYLGLAWVKQGDAEKAKLLLEASNHPEANSILSLLK